jgi:hypothetical protein
MKIAIFLLVYQQQFLNLLLAGQPVQVAGLVAVSCYLQQDQVAECLTVDPIPKEPGSLRVDPAENQHPRGSLSLYHHHIFFK